MTLSTYLKSQRELKELKVKDIADRLKVSSSYISQLERGACFPSKKQLASLAEAYQVKEDELIKRWAESKIHKVGIDTDYKFDIKGMGDHNVVNIAQKLEQSLDEFRKINSKKKTKMEEEFLTVPVLNGLPSKDIDKKCSLAQESIALPRMFVHDSHRMCAIRIIKDAMEEMGIASGDVLIIDRDAKIHNGDIVLFEAPEGVSVRYYQKRREMIEFRPDTQKIKKMYKPKDVDIIGRLIYHVKKYN